jgi:uncharacterized protein YggE
MNLKHKLTLIVIGLAAIFALSACASIPASAAGTDTNIRTLNASGEGKVYLVPDIAYINIGVHSEAATVAEALKENNAQAQAIQKALTDMGVDAKDIQTSAFNVYPQQQPNPKPGSTDTTPVTVYVVDNTVNVTVRDLQKLGSLLDSVVSSGANNINGVQFDVANKDAAMTEARKQAIQDAKNQAQEIAADAGVVLGPIQSLNVNTVGQPGPLYAGKGGFATTDSSVPVSAGQLLITASANITYILQ